MAAIWMSVSLGFLPALAFGTLRNGKAFSRSFRICWWCYVIERGEFMMCG